MIIVTILIAPTISASAKGFKNNGSIYKYRVTKDVIRFEEVISLSLPPEYGTIPDGEYYRANVYGVDVGDGVVLIDCGDDSLAKELYKSVRKAFKKPIIAVYLTHYHADHAGGGSYFQAKGVPVYAPICEMYFIMLGGNIDGSIPEQFTYSGYTPDYPLDAYPLEDGFSVTVELGHTIGAVSISYFSGDASYIFTSDTILPMQTDDLDELDMTFDLAFGTAYQNYLNSVPGYDLYGTQLATLDRMLYSVYGYDYVLTGHINPLDSYGAMSYIGYTIYMLGLFPYM